MNSGAGQPSGSTRVALVGSRYDMIARLGGRLEALPQIEVVGSFPNRREARDGVPGVRPEVVIVDADLVDGSGTELCAELRQAGCRLSCLVLSGLPLAEDTTGESGVDAVVLKSLTDDALVREIFRLAGTAADGNDEPTC